MYISKKELCSRYFTLGISKKDVPSVSRRSSMPGSACRMSHRYPTSRSEAPVPDFSEERPVK